MDEIQKFILEWLREVSKVACASLAKEQYDLQNLTIKTKADYEHIAIGQKVLDKLRAYTVREVKPDGRNNEIDS